MDKYKNLYKQISSNITPMENNMHGNPMILISAYIPHDDSDNISRDRVWEDLNGFYQGHTRSNYRHRVRRSKH